MVMTQIENLDYTLGSTIADFNPKTINNEVTVEQLLTHTSGLGSYLDNITGLYTLAQSDLWKPADILAVLDVDATNPDDDIVFEEADRHITTRIQIMSYWA